MIGYGTLTFADYKLLMSGVGTTTFGLTQYASLTCSGAGSFAATTSTNYGYTTLPALSGFGGDISSYGAGDAMFPALESYAEGGLYVPTVINYGYATMSNLISAGILGTISYMDGDADLPALISKGGEGEYGEGEVNFPALVSLGIYDATPGERKLYNTCFVLTGLSPRPDYIVFLNSSGEITGAISGNQAYIAELLASLTSTDSYTVIGSFLASFDTSLTTLGDIVAASGTGPALDNTSRVWVVNIDTGTSSQYDNYGYTAFYTHDGISYGIAADGIYELTGNTDNGVDIDALVDFGRTDLGSIYKKRVTSAYVDVGSDGKMALVIETDGQTNTFEANSSSTAVRKHRINMGSELSGYYWNPVLTNNAGYDFDLASIMLEIIELNRRL